MKNQTRTPKFKEIVFSLFIVLIPILFLSGIFIYVYFQFPELPPDFYDGNSSTNFCAEKCGDLDYLSSVNNTKYGFILCECVSGIKLGDGKYSPVASVKSKEYFFDSKTFEEVTRKEVLDKINELQ
jgi:hypothetical protein